MKISSGIRTGLLLVLTLLVTGGRVDAQKQLSLSITGPSNRDVITGSLSYTIKVTNLSATPISRVSVDDILPATVQLLSATNSYARSAVISNNGDNVAFFLRQINAWDAAHITVTVLPMAVGSITNTVSLLASGMTNDLITSSRFTVLSTQVSIHDPAMAREGDTYYLFSSGPGITFYTSKDMMNWSLGGRVFPGEPSWAKSVTSRFDGREWAPDISRHEGKYYLYYAVSAPGENDSAIGLTINKTLDPASREYQWQDQGVVLRSIAGRDLWNAIDPNIIVDGQGTPWLDFGSFWDGIRLVKLARNWKAIAEPQEWYSIAKRDRSILEDDRDPGPAQIEGPFIFKKGDYFYLFVSWGLCCRGEDSTYKIMVGRSRDVRGPYLDNDGINMAEGGGTLLLAGDKNWAGQGGCSVYSFDGKDYLVFHAYEIADHGLQKLRIARLEWDENGWPVINQDALNRYKSLLVK